jgi:hypothetical protein
VLPRVSYPRISIYRCNTCKRPFFIADEDGVRRQWPQETPSGRIASNRSLSLVQQGTYLGMQAVAKVAAMATPSGENLSCLLRAFCLDTPLFHSRNMHIRVE